MPELPRDPNPFVTVQERQVLSGIARFGPIHPNTQADIEMIERLRAAGYVAKDPTNPGYSLTARGWALVSATQRERVSDFMAAYRSMFRFEAVKQTRRASLG
jgi:hypothetical protein